MEDMCISALSHTIQSVYPVCVGCICVCLYVLCLMLVCLYVYVCLAHTHVGCVTLPLTNSCTYTLCALIYLKGGCVCAPVDLCMLCVCACACVCVYVYIHTYIYVFAYVLYNTYIYMLCGQGKFSLFCSLSTHMASNSLCRHTWNKTCLYENSVYIILPTVVSRYENIVYMYIVEEVKASL